jgi:hypothetical protein
LDTSGMSSGRLVARVENAVGSTNHSAFYSSAISRGTAHWSSMPVISATDETNQVRRLVLQLPSPALSMLFIRIQRQ